MKRESASSIHGVGTCVFASWAEFVAFVMEELNDQPDFIWRGQQELAWRLEPSLDRFLRDQGVKPTEPAWEQSLFKHLERFKLASRGRGALNPRELEERDHSNSDGLPRISRLELEENNWWAVGQHYGLKSPLLDWTTSPFVAAFFAYQAAHDQELDDTSRVVYGLMRRLVSNRSDAIREQLNSEGTVEAKVPEGPIRKPAVIEFIEPLFKDNPRLVSQGGLFTRAPNGMHIKEWVEQKFDGSQQDVWLWELVLPDDYREVALKSLNRMNINHQSLFPDLDGAAQFVNLHLELAGY